MPALKIRCWNTDCVGLLDVAPHVSDQVLYCSSCRSAIAYLNQVTFDCRCGHSPVASLRLDIAAIACDSCGARPRSIEEFRLAKYKYSDVFQKCTLDSIEGLQDEVTIAKAAIAKAQRGWFGTRRERRAAYCRHRRIGLSDVPVDYVNALHIYCNFRTTGSQNSKYYGLVGAFCDGALFRALCADYGLVDIYCADRIIADLFAEIPPLQPFGERVKLI